MRIHEVDENALPYITLYNPALVIMHPFFYPFQKFEGKLARNLSMYHGIIGIDVADSNRISSYAVRLTEYASAIILPSNYAKQSYIDSGVKTPIHVLPHGVDDEWFSTPPRQPSLLTHVAKYKHEKNIKLILTYIIHSPYRKGLDLLLEIYDVLTRERRDTAFIVKTGSGVGILHSKPKNVDSLLEPCMHPFIGKSWLTDSELMELHDLADIYLLTSRGGGFEHPPLHSLARGKPVVAPIGGSWMDYMPKHGLVESKPSRQVLEGNPIHTGVGVELKVEKAIDKICEILDNYEEYVEETLKYREEVLKRNYAWSIIGEKLKNIILNYI